jgi:hypothetical protein
MIFSGRFLGNGVLALRASLATPGPRSTRPPQAARRWAQFRRMRAARTSPLRGDATAPTAPRPQPRIHSSPASALLASQSLFHGDDAVARLCRADALARACQRQRLCTRSLTQDGTRSERGRLSPARNDVSARELVPRLPLLRARGQMPWRIGFACRSSRAPLSSDPLSAPANWQLLKKATWPHRSPCERRHAELSVGRSLCAHLS